MLKLDIEIFSCSALFLASLLGFTLNAIITALEAFAKLDAQSNPRRAVLFTGVVVAVLCLMGDVRMTWSLSAVTVLLYYGITNLAALRLSEQDQLFPKWISVIGLFSCGLLSIFVEQDSWFAAGILVVPFVLFSVVLRSLSNLSN